MSIKIMKVFLGFLISIFFVWLVFRNIHIKEVISIISQANIWWILLSVVIGLVGFSIRCYRWKIIGHTNYEKIPWLSFFKSTNMGLMLNVFVPLRGGDLYQAYSLSKKSNLPKSYVLSTVFLERLIDFCPPLLIIFVGSIFVVLPKEITLGRLLGVLSVIFISLVIVIKYKQFFSRVFDKFFSSSRSKKVKEVVGNFLLGIELLKDKWVFIKVIPLTTLVWFLSGISTWIVIRSLSITVPFWGGFLVMAITVLSVAIPSSPGFVGTWEFFAVMALSIFNVDKTQALGFALLYHFLAFLPVTFFGLIFFIESIFSKKI